MVLNEQQLKNFWNKVNKTDSCWLWTAGKHSKGYGKFWVTDTNIGAHVISYLLHGGHIPKKWVVHHKCYNRECVNPAHLEARTNKDNILDKDARTPSKINLEKTHCIHGHEFTEDNTYYSKGYYGIQRKCKACTYERNTLRQQKQERYR